jgi:hypothetical protein
MDSLATVRTRAFREVAEQFRRLAAKLLVGPQVFGLIRGDLSLDRIEWCEDYPSLRAALLEGYRKARGFSPNHERLSDIFLLVRWTFLGVAFLSAPEYASG